jgi:PAS domain S-box-containing protein
MPKIQLENPELFPNSITELEKAESALELAWEELENKTAETIAELSKAGAANTQKISNLFAAAKQLRSSLKTKTKQVISRHKFHRDNWPMAIIEWDSEFRVVDWSPLAEQIFGWRATEIIGKIWHELPIVYSADFEEVKSVVNQLLDGSETRNIFQNRNFTKDGSIVYCEWYNAALTDASGKIVSIQSFARNITDSHRTQEELQRREQAFSALAENSTDIITRFDRELCLLYVNQAVESATGKTPAELIGNSTRQSGMPPQLCDLWDETFLKVFCTGKPETIEFEFPSIEGIKHYHCRVIPEFTGDNSVETVLSISRDITEIKQAEESLKQQKEVLQTIFDNVPIMLGFLGRNAKINWVNRHWEQVLGWSLAELKGRDILAEFYPQPEYRQYVLDFIAAATQNWSDFKTKVKDGRIIDTSWANIRLSDGSCIGIGQDITERKRVESELKELNETLEAQVAQRTLELETFFDALPDHILVVKRDNMSLPFVNQIAAKVAGFDNRQQMQGKTIFECYPRQLAQQFCRDNVQVFETGETLRLQDKFVIASDTFYFDTFKIALRNLDGEVYALISTSRDITELVETKQALSERTEQLEAANRELESFSYSVSHDLRAPLRHISGFVNALKQRLEATEALTDRKIVHYMEVIEDSSQKMSLLIDGLLALSQVTRTELMQIPIDLTRLVQTAIKLAKLQLVTTSVETPPAVEFEIGDLPTVTGDPTLLQQVFSNLISNAVKFSRDRTPARIVIDSLPDGTIFVKDNGIGFEMEYADRLFGAFGRLHSQKEFEGTGIGLAIAWRIIHRHGGRIWGESLPGQGATFYFKLRSNHTNR